MKCGGDASAALGIAQRRGAGSVRHIDTRLLWIQEQEAKEKTAYTKIAGTINPADLGTKHSEQEAVARHMRSWSLEAGGGGHRWLVSTPRVLIFHVIFSGHLMQTQPAATRLQTVISLSGRTALD